MVDTKPASPAVSHPLEPLLADEIRAAVAAVRASGRITDAALFSIVTLDEPTRHALAAHRGGQPVERRIRLVIVPGPESSVIEAVVTLPAGDIVEWVVQDGVRPALLFDDSYRAVIALKADPGWQAAMSKRGITDFDKVQIDPWPTGNFGNPLEDGKRIVRCLSYYREHPTDNGYARPVEGVLATVDAARGEVLEVLDYGVVPLPGGTGNLPARGRPAPAHRSASAGHRPGRGCQLHPRVQPPPLATVVDAGVDGPAAGAGPPLHRLRGRRPGAPHPPPGLDLRDGGPLRRPGAPARVEERIRRGRVGTRPDGQHPRPGLRLPRGGHLPRRHLRQRARQPLRDGERRLHPRGGLRHPLEAQRHEHRPRRGPALPTAGRLVHRHRRELRVRLLLVLLPGRLLPTRGQAHRHPLHPGAGPGRGAGYRVGDRPRPRRPPPPAPLLRPARPRAWTAPINEVYEVSFEPMPVGEDNPWGNGFRQRLDRLESEQRARRDVDPASSRHWRFVNPRSTNGLGRPVAFRLVPGSTPTLLARPDSSIGQRAGFAQHNLWVTPYAPEERRAAGDYPNQHAGGDGLLRWTAADRPLTGSPPGSWPGTPSGSPIRPGRRTGRSCRWSTAASTCCRWASSTATPPSTSPRPRTTATDPPAGALRASGGGRSRRRASRSEWADTMAAMPALESLLYDEIRRRGLGHPQPARGPQRLRHHHAARAPRAVGDAPHQ